MNKFFDPDSPFQEWMGEVANLILLNLLWLLCSVPLITIGASTAAMYTVLIRMREGQEVRVVRHFFTAFMKDFWKATGLLALVILLATIAVADVVFAALLPYPFRLLAYIPCTVFLLLSGYLYPLFAHFDNNLFITIKNAAMMSIVNLWQSVLVLLLNGIPMYFLLLSETLFLRCSIVWLLIGKALVSYAVIWLLKPVFNKYSLPENNDGQED